MKRWTGPRRTRNDRASPKEAAALCALEAILTFGTSARRTVTTDVDAALEARLGDESDAALGCFALLAAGDAARRAFIQGRPSWTKL